MKRYGFTLIEVMIASSIFVIVAGIALSFSIAATKQVDMNTKTASALAGLVFISEKIQAELLQSSLTYDGVLADSTPISSEHIIVEPNAITFRKNIGYDMVNFVPIWSDWIRYELVPFHQEIEGDGIDNNNNGYTDEHVLRRTVWKDINDINRPGANPVVENALVTGQVKFPSPAYIARINQQNVLAGNPQPYPDFPLSFRPLPMAPEPMASIRPAQNMIDGYPDTTDNTAGGVIPDNHIEIEMLYLDSDLIKPYRMVFTLQNL